MSKKLTYEFVKNSFEKEGYKLLSNNYIGSRQKLKYICPNGHKREITWNKWQGGRRCPYCSKNSRVRDRDIEYIRKEFKKEGYILLSNEYKSCYGKLEYICNNGHRYSTSWDAWASKGSRCAICSKNAKLNIHNIKEDFEKEGYTLLSKKYINAHTKLKYICPEGHRWSTTWAGWYSGVRCSVCSGKSKPTYEFVKDSFEKEGYTLLSKEYKNDKTKLNYICPNNHKHSIRWNNWKSGCRCPTCAILNNSGPNNYNWKGGISFEPYCPIWTDKEFKEEIKARDNYTCQNPDCWRTSETLVLHHIDYDKKNCNPNNLITVCNSCNSRANKDREWHTSYYQAILNRRLSCQKN